MFHRHIFSRSIVLFLVEVSHKCVYSVLVFARLIASVVTTTSIILIYLSVYLKSQDYSDVSAGAQQGRLTMS